MKYLVYNQAGDIVLFGEMGAGQPDDHGLGTLLVTDVDATNLTHHVVDGVLVAFSDEQAAAQRLPQAKAEQWELVKAARDGAIRAGFTWDGSKFDADDVSQQRIQGAFQLATHAAQAGAAFEIEWTLFDNSTRTLSGDDVIAVGIALGAFVAGVFAAGVALRDQLNAATTLEAVRQIVWPGP